MIVTESLWGVVYLNLLPDKFEKEFDKYTNRIELQWTDGWRESLMSLPKKLLSGASLVHSNSTSADNEECNLPKLPVPKLEQTLTKYEKFLQPLLTEKHMESVKKIIQKFGESGGIGPKLQLYLENRREKMDNWAYEYWLNDMYLNNRLPLPINSNPGLVFLPRKFTTVLDVARFAARIVDGALCHKDILNNRSLPVEKLKFREPGQPLCMAQYYNILGASRIPGKIRDTQYIARIPKTGEQISEHIIVICRNQFYCVPVKAPDRGRLSEDEICAQLLYILDDAPCLSNPPPVGILTAGKRNEWAELRDKLMQDSQNCRNIDLITKSLLAVCLDEPLPDTFNCHFPVCMKDHRVGLRDLTNLQHQMLHGGGSCFNSANRWFDKIVQVIVTGDGTCGVCYEHSSAEGLAVIELLENLWKRADDLGANSECPKSSSHLPPPERLEWNLEPSDHKKIEETACFVDELIKDFDYLTMRFEGYGKDFIKGLKMSPDVYIQLALQLAYYKMHGRLVSTYESASTRRFRYGRVDCIRSASPEALAWVKAMAPKDDVNDDCGNKKVTFHLVTDEKKLELWNNAVKQQTSEMLDNIMGQGIDIHLLGLREAARETSPTAASPLPELFTDPSYRIAQDFLLSTSQVTSKGNLYTGYGAVVPDGYGASYNIKNDRVVFCIASFFSSELTDSTKFAQSIEESLCAMQALLTRPT